MISDTLTSIINISREAGNRIMEFYDKPVVEYKADNSPLTQADLAAHHLICDFLKEKFSDTPVISEESGIPDYDIRKEWDRFWLVDPLDGTKEFINKNGEFTVNVALIEKNEPVMGVVYAPAKKLMYYAEKGTGAWKQVADENPVQIYSKKADPENPLRVVCSRSHVSEALEEYLGKFTVESRIPSGSSLKFCLVADGTADLYPRLGPTMEWDVAAGDCVYRNSAEKGQHSSELTYNKPTFKNSGFVIGF